MDYNIPALWSALEISNLTDELLPDSLFILSFDCVQPPHGSRTSNIAWFNDPKKLAGYLKHSVLKWDYASLLCNDMSELEDVDAQTLLDAAAPQAEYVTRRLPGMNAMYKRLDKAFDADAAECLSIIEAVIAAHNELFCNDEGHFFGSKLLRGADELRKLSDAPGDYVKSADDIEKILNALDSLQRTGGSIG